MEGFDIQANDTLGRHQSKLDTFCKWLMNPTGALDAALAKLGPLRTNVDASRGARATLESLRAQTAFIAPLSPPVSDPRASLPLERRTGPLCPSGAVKSTRPFLQDGPKYSQESQTRQEEAGAPVAVWLVAASSRRLHTFAPGGCCVNRRGP